MTLSGLNLLSSRTMSAATGPIHYSSSAYPAAEDPKAVGSPSSHSSSLSSIMSHQYSYASSTSSASSSPSASPHQSYPQYAQYPVTNGPSPHAQLSFHPQQYTHPQGSSPNARVYHYQQQQPAAPAVYTASTPQPSQQPHHHLQPQAAPHSSSPSTAASARRPASPQPGHSHSHDGGSSPGAREQSPAVAPTRPPGSPLASSHGALTSLPLPPRGLFPHSRYTKIRTIRKTLFGKVVLYLDTERGRQVAIKLSDKALLERGTTTTGNKVAENPMEEICIMNILSGGLLKPGVRRESLPADVRAGERYVLTSLGEYEDAAFLYTVMPFCGKGEFFDLVCHDVRFAEEKAKKYFAQMVRGVRYMHAMGMVHLDLSLENLLMTDEDELKICDYGVTRQLHYNSEQQQPPQPELYRASTTNKPGKMGYMAPEIFSAKDFSGPLADVWSMGIVLFISLFGVPPYQIPAASDQRFALIFSGQVWRLLSGLEDDGGGQQGCRRPHQPHALPAGEAHRRGGDPASPLGAQRSRRSHSRPATAASASASVSASARSPAAAAAAAPAEDGG